MKRLTLLIFSAAAAMLVSACATVAYVPADLTPEELVQRAQEASDRNRPNQALQFYEALLERFPHEPAWVVNAKYEIGFIHERQGNFDEARTWLNAALALYDAPGGGLLPEKFRVLSHIVLARIDERENSPTGFFRRR